MRLFFMVVSLMGTLLLQHIIHELSHVVVAKLCGVKIKKIHWFTYSKFFGTRVFYESEPNFKEEDIEAKWGLIAISGFIVTIIIGYLAFTLYGYGSGIFNSGVLLLLFMIATIFMLMDTFYFMLGSFLEFGDSFGFGKAFKLSKLTLIISFTCIFILNLILVKQYIWN